MSPATLICDKQLRILVAEDNPVNQIYAARLVEKQGHIAHVVHNGQLALEAIVNQDFDVVLMDIGMPLMNGLEAVQKLRQREQVTGRRVPVIAVTSNTSDIDREKCFASGMDDLVSKPVKAEDLAAAFDRVLHNHACAGFNANTTDGPETALWPTSACDLSAALKRLNGDEEFLKQLAQLFLDTIPNQLKSLQAALKGSDGQLVSDLAHSVKGSVRHFSATAAYETAQRLELIAQSGNRELVERTYEELVAEIERMRADLLACFPSLH